MHFSCFGWKKTCFHEENPRRGAFVTLPRRFREQIYEDFLLFFTVLRSFFGLQPSLSRLIIDKMNFNRSFVL
ncbi:hypothetical protein GmHk_09G025829 [Glycine max]|nr:hypothetical protein GmHk_09G025829 [Glycine max]